MQRFNFQEKVIKEQNMFKNELEQMQAKIVEITEKYEDKCCELDKIEEQFIEKDELVREYQNESQSY